MANANNNAGGKEKTLNFYQNSTSTGTGSKAFPGGSRNVIIPQDIDKIMALPKQDIKRQLVDEMVNKVIALVRGHLARCRYKKLKFLHKVTGKKDFDEDEIQAVPQSMVLVVLMKE